MDPLGGLGLPGSLALAEGCAWTDPSGLLLTRSLSPKWGFPKIGGTLSGFPILRIIVYWGLYWGPLI